MSTLNQVVKRKVLLLWILAITSYVCPAQFVIRYPSPSQEITVCHSTSLLSVRVDVSAVKINNDTVIIKFPPGITYVPGTIIKTGGTGDLGIIEAGGTPKHQSLLLRLSH